MAKNNNSEFATKLGVIAATLGSAVGLGSIWRFPAEVQENGGGAFLLVYLVCVLLFGIPVMIAEISLGRAGRSDAVGAYRNIHKGGSWWLGGLSGVIASYLIMGFYMVVVGWTFEYLWDSLTGSLYSGITLSDPSITDTIFHDRMEEYICSDWRPLISTFIVIAINIGVLMMGVQKGIEKVSNILIPVLFGLLLIFSGYALTMPGAAEGLKFFLAPDFSKISMPMIANALGQTFFSLSLGMGILITYSSYYPSSTNIPRTSIIVSLLTMVVAIMMGIIIFPSIFSYGGDIHSLRGTTLVFVTLPEVFAQLPGAQVWSVLFFTLLLIAALTSTISSAEVVISFVERRFKTSRVMSVLIVMLPLCLLCALSSLSFGTLADFKIFGMSIFEFLDNFTTNFLLPLTALAGVIFIGWIAPRTVLRDQITNNGELAKGLYPILDFIIRYPAPILILIILISGLI